MKILNSCKRLILCLTMLALIVPAVMPEKAISIQKSSFFCNTAEAAFWDGWFNEAPVYIGFDEMYASASSYGIEFSDKLRGSEGQRVSMQGFMAPPLTPTIQFFVLTSEPMSLCPFCSSDADWPSNIVVVKVNGNVDTLPYDAPIQVTGQLELGTEVDGDTGFVSLVRISADTIEAL